MNPVEKAVFSLTRAILGNKKARTAFILYACALHLLVMYTTWECALSGSSQGQFQKQHNPFVRPPFTRTLLPGLLSRLRPVTTRLLLPSGIVSSTGYYTSHNIIYIALHAHHCDLHLITLAQVPSSPRCLRDGCPPSSDSITLESQRLVNRIEHRLHCLGRVSTCVVVLEHSRSPVPPSLGQPSRMERP